MNNNLLFIIIPLFLISCGNENHLGKLDGTWIYTNPSYYEYDTVPHYKGIEIKQDSLFYITIKDKASKELLSRSLLGYKIDKIEYTQDGIYIIKSNEISPWIDEYLKQIHEDTLLTRSNVFNDYHANDWKIADTLIKISIQ